ncbi:hypothetical protein ABU614_17000 [Lysobacter firmicutimachus]|uniref:Uncharacterized protein n=1 Tax=Lysobacter firmicutimachus TaxID=1792846 RepID=A0AAU8MPV7_9GAMM
MDSKGKTASRGGSGQARRRAARAADAPALPRSAAREPNPIERYIACFVTARAAAEAAGVSTAMLRRMRGRGFVSTRARALLMAQACDFRIAAAELLALPAQVP